MFTHGLSMHQKCSSYALTNLLFGLCRFMWVIELLIICPSPYLWALTRPSTLEVLGMKEQTLSQPNLRLITKARAFKVASPKEDRESHLVLSRVQKSVKEGTLTLLMDSSWTLKFSDDNFKSQNPLDWKKNYIIENLLKRRCQKWACMTHLDI